MLPHRLLLLLLLALAALALPATAGASFQAHLGGVRSVSLSGTDDGESLTLGVDAQGRLTHDQTSTGFASPLDFDTTAPGTQSISSSTAVPVIATVDGEGGDDFIQATGSVILQADGGEGDDRIFGSGGRDVLQGASGDDYVYGAAGADRIFLGTGDDYAVWEGKTGSSDRVDGGDGADTVAANGTEASDELVVSPVASSVDLTLAGGHMRATAVETVGGSLREGDDVLQPEIVPAGLRLTVSGGDGDDFLVGGDGDDALDGGPGEDDVRGGAGNDALDGEDIVGGTGNDRMTLAGTPTGAQIAEGEDGYDVTRVLTGATGDTLTLSPQKPYVRIQGTRGNAPFLAGAASEALVVDTGEGDDAATALPGTGTMSAITITGGAGDDVLRGSDGIERLGGMAGRDLLDGGLAPDRLTGGLDDDVIRARDGARDDIGCNTGEDIALTDAGGLDGLLDADACEHLESGAAAGTKALARVMPAGDLRLGSGKVKVPVACSLGARGGCQGTVSLVSTDPVTIASMAVPVLLGTQAVSLEPGTTTDVIVPVDDTEDLTRGIGGHRLNVRAQMLTPLAEHTADAALEILR